VSTPLKSIGERILKKTPGKTRGFSSFPLKEPLSGQDSNIRCLETFWTFGKFKFDLFSFIKGFKTLLFDGGKMNKDISSIVSGDKSIAFLLIKPFHTTLGHYPSPPLPSSFCKL